MWSGNAELEVCGQGLRGPSSLHRTAPFPKALLGPGAPSLKTRSLASFVESYSGVCGTNKREDFKW